MKAHKLSTFAQHYRTALRTFLLDDSTKADRTVVRALGTQAIAASWQTLDVAKLHEQTVLAALSHDDAVGKHTAMIKRAGIFFALAIAPIEEAHTGAQTATARLHKAVGKLRARTVELTACNRVMTLEISQRKTVEQALRKKESHYAQVLKQSQQLQEQLRRLSRQIMTAQENERKEISRELHDIVAQTLAGINIRLATLKQEAAQSTHELDRDITRTQQLVERSVNIVHRFARELRPPALDHLGLIPALHSYMKSFTERTGVLTHLTAFAGVETLNIARRTALFRVAQEALTNVGRHAHASRVEVSIRKLPEGSICMQITDDGKSFQVQTVLLARGSKRLGLLGMRERMAMVGGEFSVESAPSQGTTILARLPFGKARALKSKTAPRNPASIAA